MSQITLFVQNAKYLQLFQNLLLLFLCFFKLKWDCFSSFVAIPNYPRILQKCFFKILDLKNVPPRRGNQANTAALFKCRSLLLAFDAFGFIEFNNAFPTRIICSWTTTFRSAVAKSTFTMVNNNLACYSVGCLRCFTLNRLSVSLPRWIWLIHEYLDLPRKRGGGGCYEVKILASS